MTIHGNLRVIPRLDIKSGTLVKGIHLEGLRVLGAPQDFARRYYQHGADELLYMDVVASLYQRDRILHLVEQTAREIFIPLTVGGGIRNVDDIRSVLLAGADKVAINTAAIRRPDFITESANRFGSSTIVVSIEAKRRPDGSYEAYVDNGRERTGVEAIAWAVQASSLGAGEIMVTSIDHEGTGRGYDIDLVRRISDAVEVPVIACGGAGTPEHVVACATSGHPNAVAMASILHYDAVASLAAAVPAGQPRQLGSRYSFSKVTPTALPGIKSALVANGIPCRPADDFH